MKKQSHRRRQVLRRAASHEARRAWVQQLESRTLLSSTITVSPFARRAVTSTVPPHSLQNLDCAGFACPHEGQFSEGIAANDAAFLVTVVGRSVTVSMNITTYGRQQC